jgi:hypothetical protein
MTPEKELESLLVTKLTTTLPSGVQAVRKQQITTSATLPRVVVSCDVSTEDQALAQVGIFSLSVEVQAMFDAITGSDPATTIQSTINVVDSTLLNWDSLADNSAICLGSTLGVGATTNDEDRLTRTITATLWARRRVSSPGPDVPSGNMIVSGAGTAAANGTYLLDGTQGGKPKYTKQGDATTFIQWTDPIWELLSNFNRQYFAFVDTATPDLASTWEVLEGAAPAPTVTAEMVPGPPVII